MIKETLKNIVIVIVIVILGIITGLIFMNNENNIEELETQDDNYVSQTSNIVTETNIALDDKIKIENYINEICNDYFSLGRLPLFDDINEANKKWVYGHLKAKKDYHSTKDDIETDLRNIFGNDLNIDLEKDDDALRNNMIYYDEEKNMYEFIPYGTDMKVYYAINSIKKNKERYTVNVIEYAQTDSAVIGKYEEERN